MKLRIKKMIYPLALTALLILPLSCASTPEMVVEEQIQEKGEITADTSAAARKAAEAAREQAVEARAPRAVKDLFEEGEETMASAESYSTGSEYAAAVKEYEKAEEIYKRAALRAEEKREDALAAMKAADEAIANVEKNAQEARKEASEGVS